MQSARDQDVPVRADPTVKVALIFSHGGDSANTVTDVEEMERMIENLSPHQAY